MKTFSEYFIQLFTILSLKLKIQDSKRGFTPSCQEEEDGGDWGSEGDSFMNMNFPTLRETITTVFFSPSVDYSVTQETLSPSIGRREKALARL